MMIQRSVLFWVALAGISQAHAYSPPTSLPAQVKPAELEGVGITEKLGVKLWLDRMTLNDETGQAVVLSSLLRPGKPLILLPVYYNCPSLCNMTLNGFLDGLKTLKWTAGKEFDIATFSIDPTEDSTLAKAKKASYVAAYGREQANQGWHFLTGEEKQIKSLASEIGFGYRYIESQKEFAHSAGAFVLTPDGRVSRVLHGIVFPEKDLKLALLEASSGKLGNVVDRLIMLCFKYDPARKGYAFTAYRIVQFGCAAAALFLGGYLFLFWRKQFKLSSERGT